MKRFVFAMLVLAGLAAACPAFAAQDIDLLSLYTVDAKGSYDAKSVFGLDEKPWLYMELPDQVNGLTNWRPFVVSIFDGPDANSDAETFDIDSESKSDREFWLSPRDWKSIKEVGEWTVGGTYFYLNNSLELKQFGGGTTNFTVTPEPASMALFGLGAGLLGLAGIRRKKP